MRSKRLADAGEHAERQHIDLQHAERVDVVLVPFDDGAVLHGGVEDRHGLIEALAGEHEAAHMLGEMAWEAEQAARQRNGLAQRGIGRVETGLADMLLGDVAVAGAPDQVGKPGGHVLLEAHGLADLADGHARAVVDDGRADGGALAAVAPVEVLDHLLAPLVLEIDVDVGRLAPLGRDEALEQQIDARGIDGRDAEAIAHGAVGRRAAALAEDRVLPGETHDIVDGEEIARVVELGDQSQLLGQQRLHMLRHTRWIALGRELPGQLLQIGLRGLARGHRLVGIFVAQLVQIELNAPGDFDAARDGLGMTREQSRHLRAALQMPFGIGLQAVAGLRNRAFRADAGEHIGERLARGMVIERIVGGNERSAGLGGELGQLAEAPALIAAIAEGGGEIDTAARRSCQTAHAFGEGRRDRPGRNGDEDLALGGGDDLLEAEMALTLGGAPVALRQQAAQPAVRGPVGRVADRFEAVAGHETRADGQADAGFLGRRMRAHDARQRIAVGNADGGQLQFRRLADHLVRMRGPAQEREVGGSDQLGKGGHANSPCTNHRGGAAPLP